MKNLLKFGFLALAISLSVAACGGTEKTGNGGDSTVKDSSIVVTDSNAVDTLVKDSTVKDKVATDTTAVK